ncbi:MAG: hypothetical protein ABIA04_02655 [Pseudomonadota bacterium]
MTMKQILGAILVLVIFSGCDAMKKFDEMNKSVKDMNKKMTELNDIAKKAEPLIDKGNQLIDTLIQTQAVEKLAKFADILDANDTVEILAKFAKLLEEHQTVEKAAKAVDILDERDLVNKAADLLDHLINSKLLEKAETLLDELVERDLLRKAGELIDDVYKNDLLKKAVALIDEITNKALLTKASGMLDQMIAEDLLGKAVDLMNILDSEDVVKKAAAALNQISDKELLEKVTKMIEEILDRKLLTNAADLLDDAKDKEILANADKVLREVIDTKLIADADQVLNEVIETDLIADADDALEILNPWLDQAKQADLMTKLISIVENADPLLAELKEMGVDALLNRLDKLLDDAVKLLDKADPMLDQIDKMIEPLSDLIDALIDPNGNLDFDRFFNEMFDSMEGTKVGAVIQMAYDTFKLDIVNSVGESYTSGNPYDRYRAIGTIVGYGTLDPLITAYTGIDGDIWKFRPLTYEKVHLEGPIAGKTGEDAFKMYYLSYNPVDIAQIDPAMLPNYLVNQPMRRRWDVAIEWTFGATGVIKDFMNKDEYMNKVPKIKAEAIFNAGVVSFFMLNKMAERPDFYHKMTKMSQDFGRNISTWWPYNNLRMVGDEYDSFCMVEWYGPRMICDYKQLLRNLREQNDYYRQKEKEDQEADPDAPNQSLLVTDETLDELDFLADQLVVSLKRWLTLRGYGPYASKKARKLLIKEDRWRDPETGELHKRRADEDPDVGWSYVYDPGWSNHVNNCDPGDFDDYVLYDTDHFYSYTRSPKKKMP